MFKLRFSHFLYKNVIVKFLFKFDAEYIHTLVMHIGYLLGKYAFTRWVLSYMFTLPNKLDLSSSYLGVNFPNKVGLAAGFDYDGLLVKVMPAIGFGFNTVGTVTARPYAGNKRPRLGRLKKSKSLFVNKGFKSMGAKSLAKYFDKQDLTDTFFGISVGSSNVPSINTVDLALNDYLETFNIFRDKEYVRYFELNISCPNITLKDTFINVGNFEKLLIEIQKLKISQPIFVKMPSEISFEQSDTLVMCALKYGIKGFIFSNLVKDRNNPALLQSDLSKFAGLSGNFSGKPVEVLSNNLLRHTREVFGDKVVLIGCGGVFSYEDALEKFNCGADLIQLITGMIFEGPQLPSQINFKLLENAKV